MYDLDAAAKRQAEATQKAISEHTLRTRLNALRWLLSQPEGQVIWCWLLELTRYNISNSTGNSREYNYNGRRDVMIDLNLYADLLGIEGLDLRHKAERRYAEHIAELKARLDVPVTDGERKGMEVKPL